MGAAQPDNASAVSNTINGIIFDGADKTQDVKCVSMYFSLCKRISEAEWDVHTFTETSIRLYLRPVYLRFGPVIFESAMASGCTAPTRRGAFEIHRNLPLSECCSLLADHFLAGAGVGVVADAAGAPFAAVDDMHVVKVPAAVAKAGINSGLGKTKKVLIMAVQACTIDPVLVGGVQCCRIIAPEHPEIIGSVWVVACLAFTHLDGAMEIFFPGQFLLDVF